MLKYSLCVAVGLKSPSIPWHLKFSAADFWTGGLNAVQVLPVGYCDHLACVVCGKYHNVGKPDEVIEHEERWDGAPQQSRECQKALHMLEGLVHHQQLKMALTVLVCRLKLHVIDFIN